MPNFCTNFKKSASIQKYQNIELYLHIMETRYRRQNGVKALTRRHVAHDIDVPSLSPSLCRMFSHPERHAEYSVAHDMSPSLAIALYLNSNICPIPYTKIMEIDAVQILGIDTVP